MMNVKTPDTGWMVTEKSFEVNNHHPKNEGFENALKRSLSKRSEIVYIIGGFVLLIREETTKNVKSLQCPKSESTLLYFYLKALHTK